MVGEDGRRFLETMGISPKDFTCVCWWLGGSVFGCLWDVWKHILTVVLGCSWCKQPKGANFDELWWALMNVGIIGYTWDTISFNMEISISSEKYGERVWMGEFLALLMQELKKSPTRHRVGHTFKGHPDTLWNSGHRWFHSGRRPRRIWHGKIWIKHGKTWPPWTCNWRCRG